MRSSLITLAILSGACNQSEGTKAELYFSSDELSVSGLEASSEQGNQGGGRVAIRGTGFGSDEHGIMVLFGQENASVSSVTDSELEVTVPLGPSGGGKVPVTVATDISVFVYGDDPSEEGYSYCMGPGGDGTDDDFYTDEAAYIVLRNNRDTNWESWVGQTGLEGSAGFADEASPRFHSSDLGLFSNFERPPAATWTVQTLGLDTPHNYRWDHRLEIGDFVLRNPANAGVQDWVDADTLEPARPDDANALTYNTDELQFCPLEGLEIHGYHAHAAEWPVSEDFLWTDNQDGTVDISVDFSTDQGVGFTNSSSEVELKLPPQVAVYGTEGFRGGTGVGSWTLTSSGVGAFDTCFDDEDDDDRDTTLEDIALRWKWEPLPDSFNDYTRSVPGSDGVVMEVATYVEITLTRTSLAWYGRDGTPLVLSLRVPDDYGFDPSTGLSSAELPVELFYRIPTADVFAGQSVMGMASYDDPTDPRWGYLFVSVDRVTEYRLALDQLGGRSQPGDLILAYSTGDFGLFSYEHPLDKGACGDCVDNDGDGWVDGDDPDCEDDYRADGSDVVEDNYTLGIFTCNDQLDNDGDGLVDWEDEQCGSGDDFESNCADGLDNDGDGWLDDLDGECIEGGSELGADTWGCSNGLDDDGDSWIDDDDPDCTDGQAEEVGFGVSVCNNGLDDDGHGDVDGMDPYCYYSSEGAACDSEQPVMSSECVDGVDNDGDGYIDANDPDCETGAYYRESREFWTDDFFDLIPACYNGEDDDGDGQIDSMDPGCYAGGGEADGFINDETDL